MSWYSWEKRIRRAEELAHQYPASAEVLRFYAKIAQFQKQVYERLKIEAADTVSPASLELDFPHLFRLVGRIGPPPLARKARQLESENGSFSEILEAPADAPDLAFFARVLLQPYMESTTDSHRANVRDNPARCPACGEWPVAAALRGEGEGGKRWLVCSLCSREWEFRRILCPSCGEENKDRLPVYTAAEFEHIRVEACDGCHTYIKSVDLTKNGLAIPCVDELASIPLDLWAEENGYRKLQRNLLRL